MPDLPPLLAQNLDTLAVACALGLLFAALVHAIGVHGRRLERHDEWCRLLELRVANLHDDRRSREVQALQLPTTTVGPPPLSGAPTVEISELMLETQLDKTRVRPHKPKDSQ